MSADRFVDLVAVTHGNGGKPYLFEAPQGSFIRDGSWVVVETQYGTQQGIVVASDNTIVKGGISYNFAVALAEATLPLKKVVGVVKELEYESEEGEQ